jgi:gliding motility-associated-like protein
VNIHQLPTASYQNDTNCINIPNTFQSNTLHPDGNIVNYNWIVDTTNIFNHTYDSIIYAFPTLGNHTVQLIVTDVNGCKDDTSSTFFIIDRPRSVISTLDTTICAGFSVPFTVSGTYDSVRWVPSAWVSNPTADSVTIKPKQTIEYLVYTYLKTCVPKIDTVNIWVIDSVPISVTANPTSVVLGLSSDVTSHIKGTVDSIVWSPYKPSTLDCRTCDSVKATPDSTTTFTATIYYSHNGVTCMNASSVTITVIQSCDGSLLYIPDHFTPNSDGTNDLFRIIGRGIDKVNYFRIFDKWGTIIYEATDVSYDPTVAINGTHAAWNGCRGNDLNKPMNSDVYVYQFEVKCIVESSQPIRGKGTITLVR